MHHRGQAVGSLGILLTRHTTPQPGGDTAMRKECVRTPAPMSSCEEPDTTASNDSSLAESCNAV
jgi:hypothetical protein